MSSSSIWPIDWTLSAAITQGQSGPGSNGNERAISHPPKLQDWSLSIRLFSAISRTLVRRWWSYPSAEMQSVYSTAPADWSGAICLFKTEQMIDFNVILTRVRLFYDKRLGNRVHCAFILIFMIWFKVIISI